MIRLLPLFFIATLSLAEAKVSVFAHYFGQPEFVKYQYLFFKHNLLDDYEFVVFEDSNNSDVSEQIRKECEKYDIKYIHIPQSVFEHPKIPIKNSYISLNAPSFQCCVATQYIYDNYVVASPNVCLILDNDIFLISPFSIENHLGSHSFSYVHEIKRHADLSVSYMLPNFIILNPSIMPEKERLDFNMGTILDIPTDSGGYTYYYLLDYAHLGSQIPRYCLHNTPSKIKDHFSAACPLMFHSIEWSSHYFLKPETFLHIRMGSNWSNHPKYSQMTQEIHTLFESLLAQEMPKN